MPLLFQVEDANPTVSASSSFSSAEEKAEAARKRAAASRKRKLLEEMSLAQSKFSRSNAGELEDLDRQSPDVVKDSVTSEAIEVRPVAVGPRRTPPRKADDRWLTCLLAHYINFILCILYY
jgi:hypothetical protein